MKKQFSWIRDALKEAERIDKYDPGESAESIANRLGFKSEDVLRLNANENFFVPLSLLKALLREVLEEVDPRTYPQDERPVLSDALGRFLKIPADQIVIGAGGDQLIELVSHAFLKRGDEVLSIRPTFSIYGRATEAAGATYRTVSLKENFSLDIKNLLSLVSERCKMVFLCSPNNPTGNQFSLADLKGILQEFGGLAIVDEAYVDFASYSLADFTEISENLVLLRTFSKAFGLAGLRIGYAIASPQVATVLNERFQMPYPASLLAIKLCLKLLDRIRIVEEGIEEVKNERRRLLKRLKIIEGVRAFDSEANFVLASLERSSDEVYNDLLSRGILVRNIGNILNTKNCLRITVAPQPMTDRFLNAFEEVLSNGPR
jgi:histidinol-phosphate aminotransferase